MDARIDFPFADSADSQRLQGRFSSPRQVLRADRLDEVLKVLATAEQAAAAGRWVVGFVAYEAAPAFDPALVVQASPEGQPLAVFAVFDGVDAEADANTDANTDAGADVHPAQPAGQASPAAPKMASADFFCKRWTLSLDEAAASQRIDAIRAGIARGDYYQINLTMRARSAFSGSSSALFEALAASQPGAYLACLDWGDGQILSVSPELFFRRIGRTLTTRPMKGTAARHADPAADRAAAAHLLASDKERAENLMIVDLLRNDLARIAETGSVRVPALFEVEALPSVWQMTSTVSATAAPGIGLPEIFAALFPCGSVTGAPKVAAMAAIAGLEDAPRGVYCGAIGVIRPGGDAVFSVGIRSVEVRAGVATCGLGSGITIDSTGPAEYAEWIAKRRFLLRASAPFELLETLRRQDGVLVRRNGHLDRLRRSAVWFGFALDEARLDRALAGLAVGAATGAQRIRLRLARDGAVQVETFPLEQTPAEVVVRLASKPICSELEFLQHKTTERSAYDAFAPPSGVFDTLLFNAAGELTEFTRGNLFVALDDTGVWLTPPVSCNLLPGVLRAELIASGQAREAVLYPDDLRRARRICFGNSLRGLIPARLTH